MHKGALQGLAVQKCLTFCELSCRVKHVHVMLCDLADKRHV